MWGGWQQRGRGGCLGYDGSTPALSASRRAPAPAEGAGHSHNGRPLSTLFLNSPTLSPHRMAAQEALAKTTMVAPRIPIISNVDAQPHSDPDTIKAILAKQVGPCVCYRTHALPPRYPPGVFVLIAHGGQNICFNKPRFGPFYLNF